MRLDDRASAAAVLDAVCRSALRGRFGPLERDTIWWQTPMLHASDDLPRWAYLWQDDTGCGRSYVIFSVERGERRQELRCREVAALDPQARAQIFALLSAFEDQCVDVVFNVPPDAPVQALMPDPL